jgi:hypothetical protein
MTHLGLGKNITDLEDASRPGYLEKIKRHGRGASFF